MCVSCVEEKAGRKFGVRAKPGNWVSEFKSGANIVGILHIPVAARSQQSASSRIRWARRGRDIVNPIFVLGFVSQNRHDTLRCGLDAHWKHEIPTDSRRRVYAYFLLLISARARLPAPPHPRAGKLVWPKWKDEQFVPKRTPHSSSVGST